MATISVCMVARDELPFLKKGLPLVRKWTDQIVLVDAGSVDGSVEWLRTFLDPSRDCLLVAPKNTIPAHGFSFLRNVAAQYATGDWIHTLDADEMLSFEQHEAIRDIVNRATKPVLSIKTITFHPKPGYASDEWERISNECESHEDRHRRIYRRDAGIEWKGYIHEELYQGERNCFGMQEDTDLKHLHYSAFRSWADPAVKDRRYCWMLLRAAANPDLRKYTNHWWYDVYVRENQEKIVRLAKEYVDGKYDLVEVNK
jgi:glycosyltransferase involved in cell wall biosynthesis